MYVMKNKRECQGTREFHTDGAAALKPREAKVVWTRGTDNRLVLEEVKSSQVKSPLIKTSDNRTSKHANS